MRPRKRKYHGGRALLNDVGHHSTGVIVAEIENTSNWPEGKNRVGSDLVAEWDLCPDYQVTLSDCARSISLSFEIEHEGRQNALNKLDRMIGLLTEFRNGFEAEGALYDERLKIVRANEKKEKKKT